tara:strand:- start:535 stop:735 length:201 start_codon:yes stop_codon:yes gene_type:complete
MSEENKSTKKWQKVKVFDTYGEADALRTNLMNESGNSALQIKIRRCGPEGAQFKVKTYRPKTTNKE